MTWIECECDFAFYHLRETWNPLMTIFTFFHDFEWKIWQFQSDFKDYCWNYVVLGVNGNSRNRFEVKSEITDPSLVSTKWAFLLWLYQCSTIIRQSFDNHLTIVRQSFDNLLTIVQQLFDNRLTKLKVGNTARRDIFGNIWWCGMVHGYVSYVTNCMKFYCWNVSTRIGVKRSSWRRQSKNCSS